MKIYVGCAINRLDNAEWDQLIAKVATLKTALRARGHTILDFRSNEKREAEKGTIFIHDRKQCLECDAMIALAIHPSTGMGMEIMMCLERRHSIDKLPAPAFVLATAPVGHQVSPMVTECNRPNFVYREFEKWEDIPDLFERAYRRRQPLDLSKICSND